MLFFIFNKKKAPVNLKIHFKLLDLSIEENNNQNSCNDYLEIRYFNLGQPVNIFIFNNLNNYINNFYLTKKKGPKYS